MPSKIYVSPSILSADFSHLEAEVRKVVDAGADFIHVDVMDGRFVPNITVGIPVVRALSKISRVPLDVHLMIEDPERYVEEFVKAGSGIISVHQEACVHLHRTVQHIKEMGVKAGVAINPATPVSALEEIFPDVDMVVIMLVNPGFGGQRMIESLLHKVSKVREIKEKRKFNFLIEVDGGVKVDNADKVVSSGAEVLVSGSGVFKYADPAEAVRKLKSIGCR